MKMSPSGRLLAALALLLGAALACAGPVSQPATGTPPPPATFARGDDPTAGAIIRSTREAQATLDEQSTATQQAALVAQATGTAQAVIDATSTAEAQATAQSVLAAKSAWPRLLAETFMNNNLAWPVGLKKDKFLSLDSAIEAGHYTWNVTVMNGNSYFNLVPQKAPLLTDFYATVDVVLADTNAGNQSAYGLVFRRTGDDYGFFGILQDGSYRALEVHHTGIYTMLQSSSPLIDIASGHVNHLAVVGLGSDFVFLINGQAVSQFNADFDPGQVGLGVDAITRAPQAGVDFSNLEIHAPKP